MIVGGLFSRYYLDEGVRLDPAWTLFTLQDVEAFEQTARTILARIPPSGRLSEAETEKLLIFPILAALGWSDLPQQSGTRRRDDIADALLFTDPAARTQALSHPAGYERWKHAAIINENKAWNLNLDRASGTAARTPASQALRYLRLADEQTTGALRWALLCNGRLWRLYYAGSASVADRYLEADLTSLLDLPDPADRQAALQAFILFFGAAAHQPDARGHSFVQRALADSRQWQQRVTADLSARVTKSVYPALLKALGDADPARSPTDPNWPQTIRRHAVVLLYRLLFLLYAEDRDLLPTTHPGYLGRSMSHLRDEIAAARDNGSTLSTTDAFWWSTLQNLFKAVDKGSDNMGLPAYNGGLFNAAEAPLLTTVDLPDAALAEIIDGLSRRGTGAESQRINYRDLSVQQLGAIYETLLDFDVEVNTAGTVALTNDSLARKHSGSFYTPPALVKLILDATIDPRVTGFRDRFAAKARTLKGDRRPLADRLADLRRFDPAEALLGLKLADPAMGSGHFLVTTVDRLADAVLGAMEEAAVLAETEAGLSGYTSPLADRIATERGHIEAQAADHRWPFKAEQLDDRHLVRRLVLKRSVYGVDRNPLAVELAKLSLWLHSFTVGAPLSFLDHHLRCGDSLFGTWISELEPLISGSGKAARGGLGLSGTIQAARGAAAGMARIEELADADISQVRESVAVFDTVEAATAPLRAFLDCWHAIAWLPPVEDDIPPGRLAADATPAARRKVIRDLSAERQRDINLWLDGVCGDPVRLASGEPPRGRHQGVKLVAKLMDRLRAIAARQKLLHWQPAFPGVWDTWTALDAGGGFDAIVGNPPWVRQESLGAIKDVLKSRFATYDGKADLSNFFLEHALRLVRPGGRVGFVLPNKFFKAEYGEKLRAFLDEKAWIESVVDFGHNRDLFPDADVFPCVVIARRPDAGNAPEDAQVAIVLDDRVGPDSLGPLVRGLRFPMPRKSFAPEGWVLEPPEVLALMRRMQSENPSLLDYVGGPPQYGIKTGLNEAFVVEDSVRNQLVEADPSSAALFRPFLRGGDIDRWASAWPGQWMIILKSSADHPWPWASQSDPKAAEAIFKSTYPSLHKHMDGYRAKLAVREDQGRFWWELRPCAYYSEFDKQKIIYQDIQFYPGYSLDLTGFYLNNMGYIIASADGFLCSALNSPLLKWFCWRHLPHMKDDALRPATYKMVSLPIARPNAEQSDRAADLTERLAAIHHARHRATAQLRDWLRVEFGLERPPAALHSPFALNADAFATALRAALPKSRKLSVAAIAAIHQAHTDTIAPIATSLAEANRLERDLSAIVNAAYRLTPEEEALMWRTAPPRMPIAPP